MLRSNSSAMRARSVRRSSAERDLHLFLLGAQPRRFDQMILENLQASRNPADLVGLVDERNVDRKIALDQFVHHRAGSVERAHHAAAKPEGCECRDGQPDQPGDPGPDHPAKDHGVDIVDIGARLKRESLVARAKGPDIGELAKFGATGRPRRQIFDKATPGARRPHDVLDQQLAALVLEVPAVDVDVFGIGMDVSDTRIRAARPVDADIVRIFAPAHGADRGEGHLARLVRLDPAGLGLAFIVGENFRRGFDEIADRGAPLVERRIAQHQDLQGGDGKQHDRQRRNDHRKTLIDGEVTHAACLPDWLKIRTNTTLIDCYRVARMVRSVRSRESALEMTAPRRHNGAHPSNKTRQ